MTVNNLKPWISRAEETLRACLNPIAIETNELDWKMDVSSNKERIIEHLIAFANYPNGGFLVFGIRNTDSHLEGVNQVQAETIIGQLTNLGRDGIEPPLAIDHAILDVNHVALLFVYIPAQMSLPVHRRGKSIEETWIRAGATTRKASKQEVARLMLGSQALKWEDLYASGVLDAQEVTSRFDIVTLTKLRERPLPTDQATTLKWLIAEKLIVSQANGYVITNFGAIAAARRLEDFASLSRKRVRVIRYRGCNKVETIDEQISEQGYAVAFEKLVEYMRRILPHSEVIHESLRMKVTVYPEIALRELTANALIHQDFGITGAGPMIEIFDDRIEFTNPGTLLPTKKLDRLIGTNPESRNEALASAFRLYRICEERGTGFQKVVTAIELFGLPPIAFATLENAFRVTIFAPKKFADMSQAERIEAAYQHAVLKYFSNSAMTNTSLRERLRLAEKQRTQVSRVLKDALTAKRIKNKDPDSKSSKFTDYIPYWA